MIRFAKPQDTDKVLNLWNICFADDSGFNEWFFGNIYDSSNTLLYTNSDNICAMLQMLPQQLKIGSKTMPVTYIYGACTAPEYRKQGLMAELLNYSFYIDSQLGNGASILIPQEPWLFDFYKKFGYESAFFLQNQFVDKNDNIYSNNLCRCLETDIAILNKIYNESNPSCILRSQAHWQKQLDLFSNIGEGAYCIKENGSITAYAFVWQQDDYLWAQEAFAVDESHLMNLAQRLMKEKKINQIKLTGNNGSERFACAKVYNHNVLSPDEKVYINLLFN